MTPEGFFEPTVMLFGLTSSPATFQTMMNKILQDLINSGEVVSLSGMVHTRGKSQQDKLGVMKTCRMTLASAYVLGHLSAAWL